MDYQKIYENLTLSRQKLHGTKKKVGYELHHIHPRSLGGSDDESNLVLLTYREHYIAHWLLTKIYVNEPKIHYGFLCMLRDAHGNRKLTSRMVATIKKNYTEFRKWYSKINNPMSGDPARKKISDYMKNNNPNKGGAWNHTAYPVEIIFADGTKKKYPFMKDAADELTIPYISMKVARRNGSSMKKYGILQIKKIEG